MCNTVTHHAHVIKSGDGIRVVLGISMPHSSFQNCPETCHIIDTDWYAIVRSGQDAVHKGGLVFLLQALSQGECIPLQTDVSNLQRMDYGSVIQHLS